MQNEDSHIDDLMLDFFSGSISEKDRQYLFQLLLSNETYQSRFDSMIKLRAVSFIPYIESQKQDNYQALMRKIKSKPNKQPNRWLRSFLRVAAIVIFVISLSVASFYVYHDITALGNKDICYETIVPAGSQTKVILPDSSVVWLNSESTLKYYQNFGHKRRDVYLIGEGYFEVQKNMKKPFFVHTDYIDVKVLGTVFNVRAYKGDNTTEISLIQGFVDVLLTNSHQSTSFSLKVNERLIYNKQTQIISKYATEASKSALWTIGKLSFVDATIDQIAKDLERKFNVKIRIDSEQIKQEHFSGSLNLNNSLKEILTYLDVDKKFVFVQAGDTIHIRTN